MVENRSKRSKLLPVLLSGFVFLLMTTVLLTGYLVNHYFDMRDREAALMSREDLQRQLFRDTAPDHALYPHMYSDIGFVLNPFLPDATSTMWASSHPYHVNSMGLRGREIRPAPPGVTRIVLVGDSRIFGWKLADSERLEAALQDVLNRVAPSQNFDVVTVALPGWNIEAESGFLARYIQTLTPDYVVWSILPNDFQETFGTLTDGSPAGFYSRQLPEGPRQGKMGVPVRFLPMPAVESRWKSSFAELRNVVNRYQFSVLVLNWKFPGEWYRSMADLPYPVMHVPQDLLEQKSWQVELGDAHPSAFAQTQIAVALVARLAEIGAVKDPEFTVADRSLLADFNLDAERQYSASEIEAFYQNVGQKIPTGIWKDNPKASSVYYGLQRPQYVDMRQRGIVYLRVLPEMRAVKLSLSVPPEWLGEPQKNMLVVLRNRAGESVERHIRLTEPEIRIEIDLEALGSDYPVIEVEWEFDFVSCRRSDRCSSARLNSIRSIQ